ELPRQTGRAGPATGGDSRIDGTRPAGIPGNRSVYQRRGHTMSAARPHPVGERAMRKARDHGPGLTGRLTGAAARHPWRALGAWVVLLAAAFIAAGAMNLAPDAATAGTEATTASNLIKERLRQQTAPEEFIV